MLDKKVIEQLNKSNRRSFKKAQGWLGNFIAQNYWLAVAIILFLIMIGLVCWDWVG